LGFLKEQGHELLTDISCNPRVVRLRRAIRSWADAVVHASDWLGKSGGGR